MISSLIIDVKYWETLINMQFHWSFSHHWLSSLTTTKGDPISPMNKNEECFIEEPTTIKNKTHSKSQTHPHQNAFLTQAFLVANQKCSSINRNCQGIFTEPHPSGQWQYYYVKIKNKSQKDKNILFLTSVKFFQANECRLLTCVSVIASSPL